ncbi:MAG TPA: hypothetical protein VFP80_12785 [Thermoanaerobaculia bacterium]|nr:hypothetical protein [Thermoanaerobaculia bacterium]
MTEPYRKILGVIGIGACWSAAWSVLFAGLAVMTRIVDPASMEPGERAVTVSGFGLVLAGS